jgi:protein translocase SecG subunit
MIIPRALHKPRFYGTLVFMAALGNILPYIQIVLAVLLIAGILLQQRGSSLGGAFGDTSDVTFYTRRGAEKWLFQGTIIVGILFALSAFAALFA